MPAKNLILETGVACCCYFFIIIIIFLLWKQRYLKHGPWQFSYFLILVRGAFSGEHVRQFFVDFKHDSFGKCNG